MSSGCGLIFVDVVAVVVDDNDDRVNDADYDDDNGDDDCVNDADYDDDDGDDDCVNNSLSLICLHSYTSLLFVEFNTSYYSRYTNRFT